MTRRGILEQLVQDVEPAALVVEPRILRRVIRLDGRVQGLRQLVSRRATYPILRKRLLTLVEPAEVGVYAPGALPERLILLSLPEDSGEDETGAAAGSNCPPGSATLLRLCAVGVGQSLDPRSGQRTTGHRASPTVGRSGFRGDPSGVASGRPPVSVAKRLGNVC